ncbi:putative membrane protein YphA (DoxX/SURF4 family) [Nocardia transvalensis]|uniref:Putative membrane protein YphA (DoxX/SURF4 family) n=1 Tax=Nocardia transvalensis TaxID=37333 RepID=A0A7W9UH87_9NOCA|nr:DoxX family protein [Nocardia transvalensis]MBB5912465.1 putative membrane protein YphA (DoxX/SURF4 family) [Nocardia transvalensis]
MSLSTRTPVAPRYRTAAYWTATALVVAELGVGGIWDIARIELVRETTTHLGYPTYFLVLLGVWKILGAAALAVPRLPLVKEWAYAGAIFVYTGAIASHLTTGYARSEVVVLATMTVLTVASWALRPADRCVRQPLRMRS